MLRSTIRDRCADFELMERFRQGERDAGSVLFARHRQALHRFFRRHRRFEADDLVQRTFLAFIEAKDRFRFDSSVRTFLFGIANHELLSHSRKHERKDVDLTAVLHDSEGATCPLSALSLLENRQRLRRTLSRIPSDLRQIVHLYYWCGLTGAQIAEVLEVPSGTVASRLRRAKERIRELFESDSVPAGLKPPAPKARVTRTFTDRRPPGRCRR